VGITRYSHAAWLAMLFLMLACASAAQTSARNKPRDNWDFKFKGFVIGAWWGPGATDAEMKLYKECGFNVVMSGRYMQLDSYGDADKGIKELDMARRHGLWVMFDTYTKNDRPWGGKAGPTDGHPSHHPASLIELQWLYNRLGRHPALIGFMIGDDQGSVSQRAAECSQFLHAQGPPHLIPWLCGWISPKNLAEHNNPFADPQIYPTLYSWGSPAEELAQQYAATYARYSRECREQGVVFWPMFNASPPGPNAQVSDSLLRFPAYAALAYGAEGIWYFCYNGGSLEKEGAYRTEEEAEQALTPLYPVAQKINRRIAAWGPRVLGRTSTGLFGTAFGAKRADWPFKEDAGAARSVEALAVPAKGKLIEAMSDGLLVGILTRPAAAPLAMVVDCRASKTSGSLPPREVMLRFAPAVSRVNVLEGRRARAIRGNEVKLILEAGGGQMLELQGKGLDTLCSEESIYAPPQDMTGRTAQRALTETEIAGIRAAKLRMDVFGANGGPQYEAKYISLNGRRLARVPANGSDTWSLEVVDFSPEQLPWVKTDNEVTVRTECEDAWKFRNVCLAVQLADGTWIKTGTDKTVYSTPEWAFSEGKTWGKDGVAGLIALTFR
jgi:hypothetical protein